MDFIFYNLKLTLSRSLYLLQALQALQGLNSLKVCCTTLSLAAILVVSIQTTVLFVCLPRIFGIKVRSFP